MSHLTVETIERYLDADLSTAERAAAEHHLAACQNCRARLASLAALFAELAALPDEPPPLDLAPAVLARLAPPPRWSRAAWFLLVAQATLCLALALALAPLLGAAAELLATNLARLPAALPALEPSRLVAALAPHLSAWSAALNRLQPAPLAALSIAEWAWLLGAVALFWLALNSYLLGSLGAAPGEREVPR